MTTQQLEESKIQKKTSKLGDEEFWIGLAKEIGISLPKNWGSLYNETLKQSLGANEEMYELADYLKRRGVRVGLLTNIEKKYAVVAEKFGLFDPFSPQLLGCDIDCKKPDQKAYEILITSLDLSPQQIVFIDDNPANVKAAKEKGLDAFLFESPKQVKNELKKRGLLG